MTHLQTLLEQQRKKFRVKWGRFYYSDIVGMDWEKPEKIHPGIKSKKFCIASDDIENDFAFCQRQIIEEVENEIENSKRESNSLESKDSCKNYIEHQPIWDGNYYTCAKCGIEFVHADLVNMILDDLQSNLKIE